MAEPTARNRLSGGTQKVRRATFVILLVLLIQYALGMATNLYATIPKHHPGAGAGNYFTGSMKSLGWALHAAPAVLVAHGALGIVVFLAAVGLFVQAVRLRRRTVVVPATLGALFVIGAGFNGLSFLDYSKNLSSFIMALLFALATLSYLVIIYVTPGSDGAAAA